MHSIFTISVSDVYLTHARPTHLQVQAATWALDRGVCVVICNGMQEKAIKTILTGRKVGTFFTSGSASSASTDLLAEQGEQALRSLRAAQLASRNDIETISVR